MIAYRLEILVRVAVLVVDQAETLPLFAFLSDELDVLTAISAWVQQRAASAHGDAVLLDFPEIYLVIILEFRGYQQMWYILSDISIFKL